MKSKEDMIEVMARAIELAINTNDIMGLIENSKVRFVMPFDDIAEAALKAFCGALPELTRKPKFSGFIDGLVMTDAPKLYLQLKQYGENNEGDNK